MKLIIIGLALLGAVQGYTCKREGICCDDNFEFCALGHSECTAFGDTCTGGTLKDCSSGDVRALTVTHYVLPHNSGDIMIPGVRSSYDLDRFFVNDEGAECSPYSCNLYAAATSSSTCSLNSNPIVSSFSFSVSPVGDITIDTSTQVDQYACISCLQMANDEISPSLLRFEIRSSTCTVGSFIEVMPFLPAAAFNFAIREGEIPSTPPFYFADHGSGACIISSTSVVKSSSDSTIHPDLEYDSATRRVVLKDTSKKHQAAVYSFAVLVTFSNGAVHYLETNSAAKDLTLTVACDAESTTLVISSFPTVNGVILTSEQQISTGGDGKFYLPSITNSLELADSTTSCVISSRTVSHSDLAAVLYDAGEDAYYVQPLDNSVDEFYLFTFTTTAVGGASVSPSFYKLHVGCSSIVILNDQNSPGILNFDVTASPTLTFLPTFYHLEVENPACVTTSVTTTNEDDSIGLASSPMIDIDCSTSTTSCQVTTLLSDRARTLEYEIVETFGTRTYITSTYTVNFVCSAAGKVIELDPLVNIVHPQGYTSTAKYYFDPYTCAVPSCCGTITYRVSLNSFAGSNPYTLESNGSYSFSFDASVVSTNTYYVLVRGTSGSMARQQVNIEIKPLCEIESNFSMSSTAPAGSELVRLTNSRGYAQTSSEGIPQLHYVLDVDDLQNDKPAVEFDVSERFVSSGCLAQEYRITSVTETGSTSGFSQSDIDQALTITSEGLFSLWFDQDQAPVNSTFEVLIDVYNGYHWSSSPDSLFIIRTCQDCSTIDSLPEASPYFLEDLPSQIYVNSTTGSSSVEIPLPSVYDPNGDSWELSVSGHPAVRIQGTSLVVDLSVISSSTLNATIEITITDQTKRSSTYVTAIILSTTSNQISEDQEQKEGEKEDPEVEEEDAASSNSGAAEDPSFGQEMKRLEASIESISNLGELTLFFSRSLSPLNSSMIETGIDIHVRPAAGRETEEDFNVSSLNLTVEHLPESGKANQLVLLMKFNHPLEVSPLATQDTIVVHFNESFRKALMASQRLELQEDSWTLERPITKQMPLSSFNKGFESGTSAAEVSLLWLLIATFVLNVLCSGGMIYMLQMIRSLQIVLHFPLLRIIVPANVNMFFAYLIPIAMFDVLDPEWTTELVLNFDEEGQEAISDDILDQMKDLGYETHNSVLNLGSLSIFLGFYVLKLVSFLLAKVIFKMTGRGSKVAEYLRNGLFFGDLIAIVLDAYFEFIISGYLQIQEPLWTASGDSIAVLFGYLALFLALVWLPVASIWLLFKYANSDIDSEVLEEDGLKGILEGTQFKDKNYQWARAYYLVFILRRLLFVLIAVGITKHFEFQIFALLFLNTAYTSYLGLASPHQRKEIEKIELGNELLINICSIFLFLFTDWVPDEATKFNVGGWPQIGAITLLLCGNLYFVVSSFLHTAFLVFTRAKILFLAKVLKKKVVFKPIPEPPVKEKEVRRDQSEDYPCASRRDPQWWAGMHINDLFSKKKSEEIEQSYFDEQNQDTMRVFELIEENVTVEDLQKPEPEENAETEEIYAPSQESSTNFDLRNSSPAGEEVEQLCLQLPNMQTAQSSLPGSNSSSSTPVTPLTLSREQQKEMEKKEAEASRNILKSIAFAEPTSPGEVDLRPKPMTKPKKPKKTKRRQKVSRAQELVELHQHLDRRKQQTNP